MENLEKLYCHDKANLRSKIIYTPPSVHVKQRKQSIFYNKRINPNVLITYRNIEKKHIVFTSDNLKIEQDRNRQCRLLVRVLKAPPPRIKDERHIAARKRM